MEQEPLVTHIDPKTEKAGKKMAIWIIVGIAAWIAVYVMENYIMIPATYFWGIIAATTGLTVFWTLWRADFDLFQIPWGSKETTWDSAFDENGKLKILPRIGISASLVIVNFLAHGWVTILLLLCLNFIPKENATTKEGEIYKTESSYSLRGGDSSTYYFYWNGFKESFTVNYKISYYPDTIKFRCYKGFLGWDVVQRRMGS